MPRPMTPTITAFEDRPTAAGDWRVIRAFAGRSKKWANPMRFGWFRSTR